MIKGSWSQFVYQVDDSPRYEGFGEWKHYQNSSTWKSNETPRPLPRREKSVRSDYDLIIGTNIHTITPSGWVHEQNNNKVTLEGGGELKGTRIDVPADISSAAFFMVAAAITPGSDIMLEHVGVNPTRIGVINILRQMGVMITLITVSYTHLTLPTNREV